MEQSLDNTFILALDGDVEFNYIGVQRLVEVITQKSECFRNTLVLKVMQEHPKTGGVCAQMQPKRSKNNLQIFMQIFEYLTGHMMFKVAIPYTKIQF